MGRTPRIAKSHNALVKSGNKPDENVGKTVINHRRRLSNKPSHNSTSSKESGMMAEPPVEQTHINKVVKNELIIPELHEQEMLYQTVQALQSSPHNSFTPDTPHQPSLSGNDTGSTQKKSIWIVGSSIVEHAFVFAKNTYDGSDLGLKRRHYSLWWQGEGGMAWGDLILRINDLLKFERPPDVLIIHCDGNILDFLPVGQLRWKIRTSLYTLMSLLPSTKLVWSQILPQKSWRCSSNNAALIKAIARINNCSAHVCGQSGGGYIKYPDITLDNPSLFIDGVHLSNIGNQLFLFRIEEFLYELDL